MATESKTLDGRTYTIQRQYDVPGRLLAATYPDGDAASYTYNPQGALETVDLFSPITQSLNHVITAVDYNAAGQLTRLAYGNGQSTDYSYDPQTLRMDHLVSRSATGSLLQDFSYQFDAVGNITGITDRVHTAAQSFAYDALNRLTRAGGAYGQHTYAYRPMPLTPVSPTGSICGYGGLPAHPHGV